MKNLSLNLLSNTEAMVRAVEDHQISPMVMVVKVMVGEDGETCLLATTVVR